MEKGIIKFETARNGSALIMTVVLTVLLSIVAVMFVAVARMDVASTSNIADNKMLDSAARSIIAIISKELVLDTPGVAGQEYYDYADACDTWLASLQPYFDNNSTPNPNDDTYCWHQISDVTGYLRQEGFNCARVSVGSTTIEDYPDIKLNMDGSLQGQLADADGDGIADAKWFELENLHSSKGKPIYAAIRVMDNSGMININTAHTFDVNSANDVDIDGSSQMQINLKGLLKWPDSINSLHNTRLGTATPPQTWTNYNDSVIWDFNVPTGGYLPFDISDELELRYRYCIDSKFTSRIETEAYDTTNAFGDEGKLYDSSTNWNLNAWKDRIIDPNFPNDPNVDRRHLLTTYNYDRIIDPNGDRMINVNTESDPNKLYYAIRQGLLDAEADKNLVDVNGVSAQIAVNIKDYRDNDSVVTALLNPDDSQTYYGFERPCIYISELAFSKDAGSNASYAVELHKPYLLDNDPATGWQLWINGSPFSIIWSAGQQYHVILNNSSPPVNLDCSSCGLSQNDPALVFTGDDVISLTRTVGITDIVVDSVIVPAGWPPSLAVPAIVMPESIERDITLHKCIRRLWNLGVVDPTLGSSTPYVDPDPAVIQAHPADSNFTNVGQIGTVFRKGAYYKFGDPNIGIGYTSADNEESEVLLNLADPNYQKLFNYLTVFDPCNYGYPAAEMRVKGRINLNTAPWYVIAQLPWVSQRKNPVGYNDPNLAKAIVAYRDKLDISSTGGPDYYRSGAADSRFQETGINGISENDGFSSIGELMNVINTSSTGDYDIRYYSLILGDLLGFPDLTAADTVADDFEERDLIFSRISNLVTVRSDVFTAYILVRVCTNVKDEGTGPTAKKLVEGPQKRYMAILDRSGVTSSGGKVKVISFHPVPGAR